MSKKKVVIITTVLLLSIFLSSMAFADDAFKNLKAWFGDIKIFSNNQQVQLDAKPFIVDGTTYVPLRTVSNIFNKNINWDGKNLRIDITDKPDQNAANMAYLTQQIMEKQSKINELEAKVAQLEAELNTTKYSLRDLENHLNDKYGVYEKITFDIRLYGDKNDIEVEMYVDLGKYSSKWDSLTTTKIEKYIGNIVDEIKYDYKNADVTGFIEDSLKSKELVNFYLTTKGSLKVETKFNTSKSSLDSMEDYLNRYYDEYKSTAFDIELYWDKEDIEVCIFVDKDELNYLTTSQIKEYLKSIYNEIAYDFSNVYIDGYIEDYHTGKILYYFDFDSKGNTYLY